MLKGLTGFGWIGAAGRFRAAKSHDCSLMVARTCFFCSLSSWNDGRGCLHLALSELRVLFQFGFCRTRHDLRDGLTQMDPGSKALPG